MSKRMLPAQVERDLRFFSLTKKVEGIMVWILIGLGTFYAIVPSFASQLLFVSLHWCLALGMMLMISDCVNNISRLEYRKWRSGN